MAEKIFQTSKEEQDEMAKAMFGELSEAEQSVLRLFFALRPNKAQLEPDLP